MSTQKGDDHATRGMSLIGNTEASRVLDQATPPETVVPKRGAEPELPEEAVIDEVKDVEDVEDVEDD